MAIPAHPQLVGNAFVSQYYNVLRHSQQVVNRFYNDASYLTRAEQGPDGPSETVFTQAGIHTKIMQVNYADLRAEIKTVDCQDSFNGSVLVMVTGTLSLKPHEKRDFVQTFFLAPQEKGYFVLNDIFRFLGKPQPSNSKAPFELANGPQGPSPAPPSTVAANAANQMEGNDSSLAVAEEDVLAEEVYDHEDTEEDEVAAEEIGQPSEDAHVTPSELEDVSAQEDCQGDHPKKSYASILGGSRNQTGAQTTQKVPASEKVPTASPQAGPVPGPLPPPPVETTEETEHVIESDVTGKSVYVKNLALGTTAAHLEEELRRFGAIKPGGVNVKKQQHVCYAFVEFEEVTSGRAAVEASPIQIDGKPVYVEVKRPMGSRGGGTLGGGYRGGGRGRGRNEGSRGGGRGGGSNSGGYYGGRGGSVRGSSSNANNNSNYASDSVPPGGRGRGFRGGYNNSQGNNSDRQDRHNNYNSSSGDGESAPGYHHRYDNGAPAAAGPYPKHRRYTRGGSFNRGASSSSSNNNSSSSTSNVHSSSSYNTISSSSSNNNNVPAAAADPAAPAPAAAAAPTIAAA